jgi:hypothetical protein
MRSILKRLSHRHGTAVAYRHTSHPVWVVAPMSRERLGRRVSINTTMTEEVFK